MALFNKKKKFKNIEIGISTVIDGDAYSAGKNAALDARKQLSGEPTFSIVYIDSVADEKKILEGVNSVLGKEWVGVSADKQFNSDKSFNMEATVSVLSIKSDYMQFGVGIAENYKKKADASAKKALKQAMKSIKLDKEFQAFMHFTAQKRKELKELIKTDPYFIITYIQGTYCKKGEWVPGNEAEFVESLVKTVGPNVPIFGGSASSSFENVPKNIGMNYIFANGKEVKDSAVVIFVVTDLLFSIHINHGYELTDRYLMLNDIDKTGFNIQKLNDKDALPEYARLLGVPTEKYIKEAFDIGMKEPFGLIVGEKTLVKEVIPNQDNKTLHANFKIPLHSSANIMRYDEKKTMNTELDLIRHAKRKFVKDVALTMFCCCSGRRPLLNGKEKKISDKIMRKYPRLPFFGFYSFGEVGSSDVALAQVHSQSVVSLFIYDKLMTD